MEIQNRYGVKVKGEIVPYGTNNVHKARLAAKGWGGKVVDFSAIGRKQEKAGVHVDYTYRKKKTNSVGMRFATEKALNDYMQGR